MNWAYFVLGLIAYQILKMLVISVNAAIIERRQNKLLKLVSVTFPDKNKTVTFMAIDTTDKRAMGKIERQLRDQYDIEDDEDEDLWPARLRGEAVERPK